MTSRRPIPSIRSWTDDQDRIWTVSLQLPHPLLRRWRRCSVVFERSARAVVAPCRDVGDVFDFSDAELAELLRGGK